MSEEESGEDDNYCEDDFNTSGMLFSEKLMLSLEEAHDESCNDEDDFGAEEYPGDLNENEEESEEGYDSIENTFSYQLLRALDKHFMDRPIMLVRGVYKSEVLKLTVRRPTYGNLVSWTLEDTARNKFVLNVKARMEYAGKIELGHGFGHKLIGGGGRGWKGYGYGFLNLFPGSDSSIKHVDLHEMVFTEDRLHNHYSGENCIISPKNAMCREAGCGAKVWTIQFKTFSVVAEETAMSDLQPKGWSLRKEKLCEEIYLSMVGFSDGTHQLVLHREGERRSYAQIAWFKKDPSAFFRDDPDVDLVKLDNESSHICKTRVPKGGELGEKKGDRLETVNYDESNPGGLEESTEFIPDATSTPVKCRNASRKPSESSNNEYCEESQHGLRTPMRRKLSLDIETQESTEQEPTPTGGEKADDNPPHDSALRDKSLDTTSTKCDFCHLTFVEGRFANHLRESEKCLDHMKSLYPNIMRGDDETFIIKCTLLIGECPCPSCPTGGSHAELPSHCTQWWKSDGWGKMGWRGEIDADGKMIREKILRFLRNMRLRTNQSMERDTAICSQPSGLSVSKCESCSFCGGVVQHLLEEDKCLSEYVKKYLPQGESLESDLEKRKSILRLSFVLSLCALPSCQNRHLDRYVASHLTKNAECLLFYQTEGEALGFPWTSETSARIIGKKITQMKRILKNKVAAEEKVGLTIYRDELSSLFKHVCFKCGTMGPASGNQPCQFTSAGRDTEGRDLWRCAKCAPSSPSFSEVKEGLAVQTEDLKKIRGTELCIASLRPTEEVTFCLPDLSMEFYDPPERFEVSLVTKILVPIEAPAVETVLKQCEEALDQKVRLDNYRHEMTKRPFIVDIPGAFAALYRGKLAAMKAMMNRLLIGLSRAARGEIISMDPLQTNAAKKKVNIGSTLQGALRDTCPFSLPAQELRSKQSAARANVQGYVKSYIECTVLNNIEDKELQRILMTASQTFNPAVQNVNELEPIFLLEMAPIIVKFLNAKVQLLLKHIMELNYTNYDLKMVFSGDKVEVKLVGFVYSAQFGEVNKVIAQTTPAKLPVNIVNEVINQRDVLPTASLNWEEVHQQYDIDELSAKKVVSLARQYQDGEEQCPLSCLDMWSSESWKSTEAEIILRRRAVELSRSWNEGDDSEDAMIQITQTLLDEGLFEDLVTEDIDAMIIQDLKQRLYNLNPERDANSLKTLLWYHVLLLKTAGKEWTFKRKCGETQVKPYHPILLAAVQDCVKVVPVLEGESLESACGEGENGGDACQAFWKEVTFLEFVSWIMLDNYEDIASSSTVGIITTPEQQFNFTETTERDEEVDDVFTNAKNETFVISNGDFRKLYMMRPPAMISMTLAQFVVQYYKKKAKAKAVIDPMSRLGEASTDPVVGSDEMAPKAMQLNNMIIMKRRTRDLPVPLLMFTNVLDNFGEQVLFQPWVALEELTNVRTDEEGRERRKRQLELFPMAVFKREEDAS